MSARGGISVSALALLGSIAPSLGGVPDAMNAAFSETEQAALARGEVIAKATSVPSAGLVRAFDVRAAIQVRARPEEVFAIMTNCATAAQWVPHLHRCQVIDKAADRSWELIEHEVDYSWLLPRFRYRFRADYVANRRIRFRNAGGDLRDNDGLWILEPVDNGRRTNVLYQVRLGPRIYIPGWLYRQSLLHELPDLLRAIRVRATATGDAPRG